MFDERALKELASVQTEGPILSVYLNVDPTQRTAEEYKLTLRELLKHVSDKVGAIATDFRQDIEAIKRYVEYDYDWSGRGLAIFSREAEGIWYAYPLAFSVRSGVTAARRPYISPLVELDGLYGRYLVAVVDRQGAVFYTFQMGELVDRFGVAGEDVRRTRKGRGSSVHGMRGGSQASGRREAELVQRNLKDVAADLANFCEQHQPRHLLLAGAEPTVAQFQEVLPGSLRDLVRGTFVIDVEAGEAEVREHAHRLLESLEEERQRKIIDAVITSAAKGMNGVVGLDQTLSAANEGRVQLLLVARNLHQPGYQCTGCGYLTTQRLDTCVFCGSEFLEIPDAVEAVVTQVVDKGGDVEVVDDEKIGEARIGALLRY
jgi:peptide chain release factor subunit 1